MVSFLLLFPSVFVTELGKRKGKRKKKENIWCGASACASAVPVGLVVPVKKIGDRGCPSPL